MPTALTQVQAQQRSAGLSDITYEVTLDLTGQGDRFGCRATVRFRATPGAETFIDFLAAAVLSVELNGVAVKSASPDEGRLHLAALAEWNELRVVAEVDFSQDGVGLHRTVDSVDGEVYLHTKFEPFDAHRVFPCFDQPDLKAPLELAVITPEHWTALSNSPVAEISQPSEAVTYRRFGPSPALPTYLFALVAGPFRSIERTIGGRRLGLHARPAVFEALEADAEELFALVARGLDWFEQLLGQPLPYEKYDQCFVPDFGMGAMEHPGCVTFHERFIHTSRATDDERRRRCEVVLHEMAHMWFGNQVTMRWWNDLWLNESFATLLATQAQAAVTEFAGSGLAFTNAVATARRADDLPTSHAVLADIPDTDAARLNFDGITYRKGAAVLRQLSELLGEPAWVAGLRLYLRRHAGGNAAFDDLIEAFEEASGRDLSGWAALWLTTAGCNTLTADRSETGLRVEQSAPLAHPVLRPHRIRVGLFTDDGNHLKQTDAIEVTLAGAVAEVAVASAADADLVLVNQGQLSYAKSPLDPRSTRVVLRRLGALPDATARAAAWESLWDAVLDARLAARHFVQCVVEHTGVETDAGVLQRLWDQAVEAAEVYGEPANRVVALSLLCAEARSRFAAADAAGDHQLVWARLLAATAAAPDDLALLADLLAGSSRPAGLVIDSDLRWRLLTRLAAYGRVGRDQLLAELESDPSDDNRRRFLAAGTARPDADAKRGGWDRAAAGIGSLVERRAVMAAWRQPGQEPLLDPYTATFFASVAQVWEASGPESGVSFARAMYPRLASDHQAVLAADDRLATARPLPASLKRVLSEERTRLSWISAARERDSSPAQ